jgi:hypothetical protein
MPGILFTRPKPCDQTDVWSIVGFVSCEQNCCFIMCPIVMYLVDVVNQVKNFMLYLYNTPKKLDAGDRFELPMHLAYETGVVATLPAQLFIYC